MMRVHRSERFRRHGARAHTTHRWAERTERGSATVEMVILTPVIVALFLMVVFLGQAAQARENVRHAADQGARAASLVHPTRMTAEARRVVEADLAGKGDPCQQVSVGVSMYWQGDMYFVQVGVHCRLKRAGLDLLGVTERWVSHSSAEVVDRHRAGNSW